MKEKLFQDLEAWPSPDAFSPSGSTRFTGMFLAAPWVIEIRS
jgi:hypothetical protein